MQNEPEKEPQLGQEFVKEFFIVAVTIKSKPGAFAIVGDGGGETSTSAADGLFPCIGTDRATAEIQFQRAKVAYELESEIGTVIMIKFVGGVIEKIAEYKQQGETAIQA